MSEIKKLIEKLCPNGVEFKKLGEVCEVSRGVRVVKKDLSDEGTIPVYQNSLTPLGYYNKSNYPTNTPFIICGGAAGQIGYSYTPYWGADDCFSILCPDFINSRYVYHAMLNSQNYFMSRVRKASIPRLSRSTVDNFEIPVPPLEVQSKIVEYLDNFTLHLNRRYRDFEVFNNTSINCRHSTNSFF